MSPFLHNTNISHIQNVLLLLLELLEEGEGYQDEANEEEGYQDDANEEEGDQDEANEEEGHQDEHGSTI